MKMYRKRMLGLVLLLGLLFDNAAFGANPYKLSVRVLNPLDVGGETHVDWGPPGHHTPWLGDWAFDLWQDNFSTGLGYTCGRDVFLKIRTDEVPGGWEADEIKARVSAQGYACRSGVYGDGGYMQKFGISARYGGTWYDLGWVLYAHIDQMVYSVGQEFDPTNAYIGTVFQGGTSGSCWGSCHLHIEFNNTDGASCYNVLPPVDGIGTDAAVGLLGGGIEGGHCFRGAPRVQYGREYWVVASYASLEQFKEVARQAYENRNTVGFSYDDAGIGDLDHRKVVVWGEEHDRGVLLDWYRQHYGGVHVEFRALPGEGSWTYGPYSTVEPGKHRGQPRVQYAREYWVVNSQASLNQFLSVVDKAFPGRRTVGFSYDDAGIGDLDKRTVVVWGSEFAQQTLIDWYNWYYSGVSLSFEPGY